MDLAHLAGCAAAFDVAYDGERAVAAAVLFRDWADRAPAAILTATAAAAPYEPGAFYKRELPALLAALAVAEARGARPALLVVDGYVWLGPAASGDPHAGFGLGARLAEATGLPVVGVAKTPFGRDGGAALAAASMGGRRAAAVLRGAARNPIYVTAVGLAVEAAAQSVARMHGEGRAPSLLKAADAACRAAIAA